MNQSTPDDGDSPDLHDDAGPSKSQRKRDMTALQDLGERLLELPPARLRALQLPEKLTDAVDLARRITSREGRRRQLQYIGRLMRDVDPSEIRALFEDEDQRNRADVAAMHAAERWRDDLLARPDALTEFVDRYPKAKDRNLHALVRNARTDESRGRRGRHYRELYRELRDAMATDPADGARAASDPQRDRADHEEPNDDE